MEYRYSIEQRITLQAKYFKDDEKEILLAFKKFVDKFEDLKGVSIDMNFLKIRNYEYSILIENRVLTIRVIALNIILKSVSIEISNNGKLYKIIDASGKKLEELLLTKEEIEDIFFENKFNYEKVISSHWYKLVRCDLSKSKYQMKLKSEGKNKRPSTKRSFAKRYMFET